MTKLDTGVYKGNGFIVSRHPRDKKCWGYINETMDKFAWGSSTKKHAVTMAEKSIKSN